MTESTMATGSLFLQGPKADMRTNADALTVTLHPLAYLISALKELSSFDSGQMRMLFLLFGLLLAAERAARYFTSEASKEQA